MDDIQAGRVLERVENLATQVKDVGDRLDRQIQGVADRLDKHYVTSAEFEPVKKIVYAMVAVILVGFVGALIALVYRGGGESHAAERPNAQAEMQP